MLKKIQKHRHRLNQTNVIELTNMRNEPRNAESPVSHEYDSVEYSPINDQEIQETDYLEPETQCEPIYVDLN